MEANFEQTVGHAARFARGNMVEQTQAQWKPPSDRIDAGITGECSRKCCRGAVHAQSASACSPSSLSSPLLRIVTRLSLGIGRAAEGCRQLTHVIVSKYSREEGRRFLST
jgi:hypothetical protein